jgi:hypothetical protein
MREELGSPSVGICRTKSRRPLGVGAWAMACFMILSFAPGASRAAIWHVEHDPAIPSAGESAPTGCGLIGLPGVGCTESPVLKMTWGRVKAGYLHVK